MKPCLATGWLLALLVLSLTGCVGIEQTSGTSGTDVLHVVRTELPGYHFAALNRVIRDAAQVQDLYKAAFTLKTVQPGALSCPVDLGLEYHLAFLRGTTSVQQMNLDATGCQLLHISAHDVRFTSPSFRHRLRRYSIFLHSSLPVHSLRP